MRLRAQRAYSITHKVERLCDLVRLRNCAQNQRFSFWTLFRSLLFQDQHFQQGTNITKLKIIWDFSPPQNSQHQCPSCQKRFTWGCLCLCLFAGLCLCLCFFAGLCLCLFVCHVKDIQERSPQNPHRCQCCQKKWLTVTFSENRRQRGRRRWGRGAWQSFCCQKRLVTPILGRGAQLWLAYQPLLGNIFLVTNWW